MRQAKKALLKEISRKVESKKTAAQRAGWKLLLKVVRMEGARGSKKLAALKRKLLGSGTVEAIQKVVERLHRRLEADKRRKRLRRSRRRARGAAKKAASPARGLNVRIHFRNGMRRFRVFHYGAAKSAGSQAGNAGRYASEWRKFPVAFDRVWKATPRAQRHTKVWRFWLSGYASSKGLSGANMQLSQKRARAMACYLSQYLRHKGARHYRLHIGYFGESKARGRSAAGQARDRFVEVFMSASPRVQRFLPREVWTEKSAKLARCAAPARARSACARTDLCMPTPSLR